MADEVIRIPLRRKDGTVRAYALIDEDDATQAEHRWHLHGSDLWAIRQLPKGAAAKRTIVALHREILGLTAGDGLEGDHINGVVLDCRRSNLRIVTRALNQENVPSRGGSSRYRGVTQRCNRWVAQAMHHRRKVHLGTFVTEAEAAAVARAWRLAHMSHTNEARSVLLP